MSATDYVTIPTTSRVYQFLTSIGWIVLLFDADGNALMRPQAA